VEEAIRGLEQQSVDMVVAAMELSADGTSALLTAMQRHPVWNAIPVLALVDPKAPGDGAALLSAGFHDCQARYDREAMLRSLARLAGALAPTAAAAEFAGKES
jgi:CheY-like chemotaxis protein